MWLFFFSCSTDIQEIPENIKYLKSLQSADFSSNPLSKWVGISGTKRAHSLWHELVWIFSFTSRLPAGFVQLRSLTVLGLNDVSLTQLPHDFGRWAYTFFSLSHFL